MPFAEIAAALGAAPPAQQPAAAPAPQPQAAPAQPAARLIRDAQGQYMMLPAGGQLPPGAQFINPNTGQPYEPINPPGEAQPMAAPAPQVFPNAAQGQTPSAPSPFVPAAPAAAIAQHAAAPATVSTLTPPTPPTEAAPKARTRRKPAAGGQSAQTPGAEGSDDTTPHGSVASLIDELVAAGYTVTISKGPQS